MRDTIIGLSIGVTLGIVIGTSVVSPGLQPPVDDDLANAISDVSVPQIDDPGSLAGTTWIIPDMGEAISQADRTLIDRGFTSIDYATNGAVRPAMLATDVQVETPDTPYDLVINGDVDAAMVDPGAGATLAPVLDLFGSVPFGPAPRELTAWLYAGGGNELLADVHASLDLHAIPCAIKTSGSAGWFTKSVAQPSDLKGLRMRIEGLAAEAARKLGVETVEFEDSQLLAAFRTGHLDAAETATPAEDELLALHEGAQHYLFPGWHKPATLMVLLTKSETWSALPDVRQTQIELACGDNVRHGIAESEAAQFAALQSMSEKGVEVARLPEDVVNAFSSAWNDVASEKGSNDPVFQAVWQSLETFRADYSIWQDISTY